MTTWTIANLHKKSAVERQFWYKDGKVVIREEGYRWGTFYCESDEKPDIDLSNPDELILQDTDYDWELQELDDGCWADWSFPDDMSDEEREEIEEAWEEDYFEGMEKLGWNSEDVEYVLYGPLSLTNEDTGETFSSIDNEESIEDLGVIGEGAPWPFPTGGPDQDK